MENLNKKIIAVGAIPILKIDLKGEKQLKKGPKPESLGFVAPS